jgi:Fe-S cluster assembly protein SufD
MMGLPTPKLERFKYFNVPAYLKTNVLEFGAANITLEGNTEYASELGASYPHAFVQDMLEATPAGEDKYGDTMLWDLANSVVANGHVIDIPERSQNDEPLNIKIIGEAGKAFSARQIIRAGDNSDFTINEHQLGEGAYWNNSVSQIKVGKGARLRHYRIQENSDESLYTQKMHIQIEEGGSFEAFTLTNGSKSSRNQIHVELLGPNAEVFINGINLLDNKQVGDATITVEHKAPNCLSKQNYRSVIADQAVGVFQGKAHVHQIAQKTDGYQFAKALLLSPQATMNTKPELEIYADDVKCSHGATTGQLDDEALFYLRSRGISKAQAKALLIEAFIGELFEEITCEAMREEVSKRVSKWLEGQV